MRRFAARLLTVLLVLAAVVTGIWWWTTGRLLAGWDRLRQDAAAQGWSIAADHAARGGWPLAAELRLDGLAVAGGTADLPGGAAWRAEHLVVRLAAWQPDTLALRAAGPQRIRLGRLPDLPFAAQSFVASIPVRTPNGPVQLVAEKLAFEAPLEGMTIGLLKGPLAVDPAAGKGSAAVSADLAAEAIRLPPALHAPLGGRLASASFTGAVLGPLPPDSLATPADRARSWRDGGGAVRIARYAIGWGPLGATGALSLGLDGALQPQGSGTLRAVGYDAALAALAESGAISPATEQAARAVLGLLATTPEEGGAPQVTLPLALKGGVVSAGRIPVARLPALDWSGAATGANVPP